VLKTLARGFFWNGDTSSWYRVAGRSEADGFAGAPGEAVFGKNVMFNGTYWDRQRNNAAVTVLASADRVADAYSTDQTNYNHRGIILFTNCSAIGDDTYSLTVQGKDPLSGRYYTIATFSSIASTGLRIYEIHPEAAAASGGITAVANRFIPRTWRIFFDYTQVGGAADAITASVSAVYLP
jgi:hypothetical protein